jgi:pilus assembly protein CpaB
MSRASGCLWLAVALILALVAGGVAFVTMQRATVTQAESVSPVASVSVVVAVRPMPLGAKLTTADLSVQNLPASAVPTGAVRTVAEAADQLTTVPLETGEMVLNHHLVKPDISGKNLAFTLPEGLVGITIPAEDLLSRVAGLQANDHVDILYSIKVPVKDGGSNQYTFGTLQDVTLVSVVRGTSAEKDAKNKDANDVVTVLPAEAYVLAMQPQDALVLKYLKDSGAIMDLALRNVVDDGDHATKPVDLQYMIDRFQLSVP